MNYNLNNFQDISWLHGSNVLKDVGDRVEIVRRRNAFLLNLYDIRPDDNGTYACMAVNPTGEKCQHFNLCVDGKDLVSEFLRNFSLLITKCFSEAISSNSTLSLPSINCKFQVPVKPVEDGRPTDLQFEVNAVPEARVLVLKNKQRLQPNEYVDIGE